MSELVSIYKDILEISKKITDATQPSNFPTPSTPSITISNFPPFISAKPVTAKLVTLNLPVSAAEQLSQAYLRMAEELRTASEAAVRTTCLKLTRVPRSSDCMPLDDLQKSIYDTFNRRYKESLSRWLEDAIDLVRARLAASCHQTTQPEEQPKPRIKNSKRRFKPEYLPLFEFAFEKDRFPSREDKKHLARISNMSYRQVSVWFQNRRCRQASHVKPHRIISAPKTFEEMKERLGPSAREALSKPLPFMKKLNHHKTHRSTIGAPVLAQDTPKASPVQETIVLDDASSPESSMRAVSLEATDDAPSPVSSGRAVSLEATDDGYESDDCDELADDDFLEIPVYQLPTSVEEPTAPPQNCHPLNPPKTSVHTFPAVYQPSQLTSDPFVIEHHPWLRDPRTNSRKFINPTPEAMEDIMDGFDCMDVDELDAKTADERLSRLSTQRNVSSGSFGMWSSGESTAASHASSYSPSAPSSSPRNSEAELPILSECTLADGFDALSAYALEVSEYTASPGDADISETDVDAEAETVCDSLEEEGLTAGPSAITLVTATWESPAEERVDAWASESQTLHSKLPSVTSKWQDLLAVAAHAT